MTSPDPAPPRSDPFLDEVHRLKREAIARSGGDLTRHIERLREIEKQYKDRLVPSPERATDGDTSAA
jgi:hypothetical protein